MCSGVPLQRFDQWRMPGTAGARSNDTGRQVGSIMARAAEKADPASRSFFSSLLSGSRTSAVVAHQPQAEIARRRADRTAALEGIADEIRDIGPVCAFDHAHAAIDQGRANVSTCLDLGAHETAVGHSQTLPARSTSPRSLAPNVPTG